MQRKDVIPRTRGMRRFRGDEIVLQIRGREEVGAGDVLNWKLGANTSAKNDVGDKDLIRRSE